MDKSGNLDDLVLVFIIRDRPLILAKRVKFTDKEPSSRHKHPRRFRKHWRQVFEVLQNKVAAHQIGGEILAWPTGSHISQRKHDIVHMRKFRSCLLQHPLGKIEGLHPHANTREQQGVLSRPAPNLNDGRKARLSKDTVSDHSIEIPCRVYVGIIRLGPLVIGMADVHEMNCWRMEKVAIVLIGKEYERNN